MGDLIDAFVNDGEFIAFIPWVKETREVTDARSFDPIPDEAAPADYFAAIIAKELGAAGAIPVEGSEGWDWLADTPDGETRVAFYTRAAGRVEMTTTREVVIYDGPRIIQKEWEDVLYPPQAANLHIPGPSNPHGAGHVIFRDYPGIDEIVRLAKSGTYDRIKGDDLDAMRTAAGDTSGREMADQKNVIQGTTTEPPNNEDGEDKPVQKRLTRLMCFDMIDIDGDGRAEDVVWWIIVETRTLVRAARLTEVFPNRVPRRPIVHRSFLPVRGRVAGVSLLETIEGLHDQIKVFTDQVTDSAAIKIVSPWFYRASGGVKPEIIRMAPGEGYPLQDPKRDVVFPQFSTQAEVMALNMIAMIQKQEDQVTTIGGLQQGQVPAGKSSALRTASGMAMILGQGEARPERILRRFFSGLAEIWRHIHGQNQFHLPDEKRIRIVGLKEAGADPYRTITRAGASGEFEFDFKANVLNTSKAALQQSIESIMAVTITEIAISMGIADADTVYKLMRAFYFSQGQDPDQFIKPPSAKSLRRRIFAEEAISVLLDNQNPDAEPAEAGGAAEHLATLQQFMSDDNFGLLTPPQVQAFSAYIKEVAEKAALEQQQAQQLAAAGAFQNGGGQGGTPGRPPEGPPPDSGQPVVNAGELVDESLPTAGGGASGGGS